MTLAVLVGFSLFGPAPALAQTDTLANLDEFGTATGLSDKDPRIIAAEIIRIALGFLGIIAVILVLYGGWLYMTSAGDPGKVDNAQKVLINATIGLVIILSALAITQFVLNSLLAATGAGGSSSDGAPAEIIDPFSTALGAGIIDSHFPGRGDVDLARNVLIAVTFREAIDPATIIDGYDPGDPSTPRPLLDTSIRLLEAEETLIEGSQVNAVVTPDNKTVVLDPVDLLGSPDDDIWYLVELTDNIKLAGGEDAFTGSFADGYAWRFRTGTFVDLTPPKVVSVVPFPDSSNPRNILVQINYDEAINPVSASGFTPTFTNISATDSTASVVTGEWKLLNQYRTNEFITDSACGINSCGETIYCLPGNETISVVAQAADLGAEPPQAASVALPNGVTDMYGNSLDGDADGEGEGPPTDNFAWSFSTTNEVILTPPEVASIVPDLAAAGLPSSNIAFDQEVFVTFDTPLSLSTVNADNMALQSPSDNLWFTFSTSLIDPDPTDAFDEITDMQSQVQVQHGIFSDMRLYGVEATSGVRSIFQNCFTPSVADTCIGNDPNCCNGNTQTAACEYPEFTLPTP